jgi:hypothetical protein
MTDSTLKIVVLLDPETKGYKPAAHNLEPSGATDLVQQFSAESRTAKILDQQKRHRNPDPTKCTFCKKAADAVQEVTNAPQSSDLVAS